MPPEFYELKGNDDGVKEVEVKSILTEFHFPRSHSVRYPHRSFHFSTVISITVFIDGYLYACEREQMRERVKETNLEDTARQG